MCSVMARQREVPEMLQQSPGGLCRLLHVSWNDTDETVDSFSVFFSSPSKPAQINASIRSDKRIVARREGEK